MHQTLEPKIYHTYHEQTAWAGTSRIDFDWKEAVKYYELGYPVYLFEHAPSQLYCLPLNYESEIYIYFTLVQIQNIRVLRINKQSSTGMRVITQIPTSTGGVSKLRISNQTQH